MYYRLKHELPHDATTCLGWLLDSRGIDDIEEYVNPSKQSELDPHLLDNIDAAADKIIEHMEEESNVLFVVDCDTDGFCSSAMLWLYLKHFFPRADLNFICHEHKEHGLEDIIDTVEDSDYDLVILPDSSSSDYDFHERLKEHGKDVVVIDHHEAERYSENAIVVNNQLSERYPNKSLCGAGVVYKLLMILDEKILRPDKAGYAEHFIDLCALANIADCMSMKAPETRYYIVEGLKQINNEGFKALIDQQSFSLFKENDTLNYISIAFYIAPLINAVIRVGTMEEKEMLFEGFITPNKMVLTDKRGAAPGAQEKVCVEIARRASNIRNRQNRIKERGTDLLDMRIHKYNLLDNKVLVIETFDEDEIPQELRGLICAQFVNKYHRPCAVVKRNSEGFLRGSIRGNDKFAAVPSFKKFLEDSGQVEYVQGHANSAGLSIHEDNLPALLDYANSKIDDAGLENVYEVDYIFDWTERYDSIILAVAGHPDLWGNDIEEPTLVIENIPFNGTDWQIMGTNKDSAKLYCNRTEFVRFKDVDFCQEVSSIRQGQITIYGELKKNTWRGRTTAQVLIKDYEIRDTTYEF